MDDAIIIHWNYFRITRKNAQRINSKMYANTVYSILKFLVINLSYTYTHLSRDLLRRKRYFLYRGLKISSPVLCRKRPKIESFFHLIGRQQIAHRMSVFLVSGQRNDIFLKLRFYKRILWFSAVSNIILDHILSFQKIAFDIFKLTFWGG